MGSGPAGDSRSGGLELPVLNPTDERGPLEVDRILVLAPPADHRARALDDRYPVVLTTTAERVLDRSDLDMRVEDQVVDGERHRRRLVAARELVQLVLAGVLLLAIVLFVPGGLMGWLRQRFPQLTGWLE